MTEEKKPKCQWVWWQMRWDRQWMRRLTWLLAHRWEWLGWKKEHCTAQATQHLRSTIDVYDDQDYCDEHAKMVRISEDLEDMIKRGEI